MEETRKLSRRTFLRGTAVLGGSLIVAACAPTPAPAPTQAPAEEEPAEEEPMEEEPAEEEPTEEPAEEPGATAEMIPELGPYLAHTSVEGDLDFWNCWGGERIPLMETQIADFQEYYPGVEIENNVSPCSDLLEKGLTAMAAGMPPDVFMLQSNSMPAFVMQDALLPIDELVERDELDLGIYFPGEIGTHFWQGKLYSVPNVNGGGWHLVYYNKGAMAEVGLDSETYPISWEELDVAADASLASDSYFLEPSRTFNEPMFLVWLFGNGGRYLTEDYQVGFNTPEGLEVLEWMLQFVKRQADSYEGMASGGATNEHVPAEEFCQGAYMSYLSGTWELGHIRATCPDVEYGVAQCPYNAANPDAKQTTPISGGWGFVLPKGIDEAKIPAAWEWMKYISAGEGNRKFTKAQLRPSPVIEFTNDPELGQDNPYWHVILADLGEASPMPVTPAHPEIKNLIYDMQYGVLYETVQPQEALDFCAQEAQKLLDEEAG
jgi:ABC-type glycerol-3-phosphate transport system substrate-binding protein